MMQVISSMLRSILHLEIDQQKRDRLIVSTGHNTIQIGIKSNGLMRRLTFSLISNLSEVVNAQLILTESIQAP